MSDEKQKAVAPPERRLETEPLKHIRQMQDTEKPHDSQCVRHVLRHVSEVLRRHAEILAFYEAKKTHDVLRIVGRCKIYQIANSKHKRK